MAKLKIPNYRNLIPWIVIVGLLYCFPRYAGEACYMLLKSALIVLAFYLGRVACEDTPRKTSAVIYWLTTYLLICIMALAGLDFLFDFKDNKDALLFSMVIAGLLGIGITKSGNKEK